MNLHKFNQIKNHYFNTLFKITMFSLLSLLIVAISQMSYTYSAFSSETSVENNSMSAGVWIENINNGPQIPSGDVVINEVMWMGSDISAFDEWIELRNMTDQDINISNWKIENARSAGGTLEILSDHTIVANGFFLIARRGGEDTAIAVSADKITSSGNLLSLSDNYQNNGALTLTDEVGTIIDQTPPATESSWPQGTNTSSEKRWSMQRGQVPGDGADPLNWYTCDRDILYSDGTLSIMESYWKEDHQEINCGTPGHMNLSSNDPTKISQDPEPDEDEKDTEEDEEKDDQNDSGSSNNEDEESDDENGEKEESKEDNDDEKHDQKDKDEKHENSDENVDQGDKADSKEDNSQDTDEQDTNKKPENIEKDLID